MSDTYTWEQWDAQNDERDRRATAKVTELLGHPSYHHPGDGRPAWEEKGKWRMLVGDGNVVLFLDDKEATPSDKAFQALGYCLWIGCGAYLGTKRRISAERDDD